MNPQILTLFGEEYAPQPVKPARGRAKKKTAAEENEPDSPAEPLDNGVDADGRGDAEVGVNLNTAAGPGEEQVTLPVYPEAVTSGISDTVEEAQEGNGPGLQESPVTAPILQKGPEEATKKKTVRAKKTTNKKRVIQPKADVLKGWVPAKQYYSIGEVSRLFDVNTSHIRFWTNEFALKVRTTKKGDRLYTPAQIEELRVIYELVKVRGFTLAGAKAKLKEDKKEAAEKQQIKQSLMKLKSRLKSIRQQLA